MHPDEDRTVVDGVEVSRTRDQTTYAGQWPERAFTNRSRTDPLWLGYHTDHTGTIAPVTLAPQLLARHVAVFGDMGTSKTTLLENLLVQLAAAGHGFCYVGGDSNSGRRLLERLPSSRLDDLVWIDLTARRYPAGDGESQPQVVPIDPLAPDVGITAPPPGRTDRRGIATDLVDMVRTQTALDPTTATFYTDLFTVLCDVDELTTLSDLHALFAAPPDEGVQPLLTAEGHDGLSDRLTDLLDTDSELIWWCLEALTKCLTHRTPLDWCDATGTVAMADLLEESKIVVLANGEAPSPKGRKHRLLTVLRRLWNTARHTDATDGVFPLVIDDLHYYVAGDGTLLQELLVESNGGLGLLLASRPPTNLPDPLTRTLLAEVNTIVSLLHTPLTEGAVPIPASRLSTDIPNQQPSGTAPSTVHTLTRGQFWLSSGPSKNTTGHHFPPLPPRNETETIDEAIATSRQHHAVPVVGDQPHP